MGIRIRASLAACAVAVSAAALAGCTTSSTSSAPAGPAAGGGAATGAAGSTHCTYTPTGSGNAPLPPATVTSTAPYTATMHTSQGDITLNLDTAKAPCTVNSFVHLAQAGFWNDTQCHRISDSAGLFMLQCGDPTAAGNTTLSCQGSQGSGGPGYSFNDENLTGATYNAGTLAMANAGPDTNGSQFFLVFADSQLSPAYTPFGTISSSGVAVLRKVAQGGTSCLYQDGSGVPKDKVVINSVAVATGQD